MNSYKICISLVLTLRQNSMELSTTGRRVVLVQVQLKIPNHPRSEQQL